MYRVRSDCSMSQKVGYAGLDCVKEIVLALKVPVTNSLYML